MAQDCLESLITRKQAGQVLSGLEQFDELGVDFDGVESIGIPSADEIFRVFRRGQRHVQISAVNAGRSISKLIRQVVEAALRVGAR